MLIDWDKFVSWMGTPLSQIAFWFQWYRALIQPIAQLYADFMAFVNVSLINISQNGMKIVLLFNLNKLYTTSGSGITITRGGAVGGTFLSPSQSVDANQTYVWINSSTQGNSVYDDNIFLESSVSVSTAFSFTVYINDNLYVPTTDSQLIAYINTFIPSGKTFQIIHYTA